MTPADIFLFVAVGVVWLCVSFVARRAGYQPVGPENKNPPTGGSAVFKRGTGYSMITLSQPTVNLRWYGGVLEQMFLENGEAVWRPIPRVGE